MPIVDVEGVEGELVEAEPEEDRPAASVLKSFCSASIAALRLIGPLDDAELDVGFDVELALATGGGGVRAPGICACKASKNDRRSLPSVPS